MRFHNLHFIKENNGFLFYNSIMHFYKIHFVYGERRYINPIRVCFINITLYSPWQSDERNKFP